eukprot:2693894-Ditylum_brightwellii.AAC.1
MGGLSYSGGWNIAINMWGEGQMVGFPFGRILLNGRHPIRKPSVIIIFPDCTNHFQGKKVCMPYGGEEAANRA